MLNRLTGQPEILHAIAMPAPTRFDVGRQVAEYLARGTVDWQQRLAAQAAQCGQAFLADSGLSCDLCTEFELGDGHWRKKNRLISCKVGDISWCQVATFDIDPDTRIDQEAHGSRISFSTVPVSMA